MESPSEVPQASVSQCRPHTSLRAFKKHSRPDPTPGAGVVSFGGGLGIFFFLANSLGDADAQKRFRVTALRWGQPLQYPDEATMAMEETGPVLLTSCSSWRYPSSSCKEDNEHQDPSLCTFQI